MAACASLRYFTNPATDCRIQQERENIEAQPLNSAWQYHHLNRFNVQVRLREMRARMAEERRTRLEQIQAEMATKQHETWVTGS